jgi:DNA-binding LacI/PurR family transcriptional regulator
VEREWAALALVLTSLLSGDKMSFMGRKVSSKSKVQLKDSVFKLDGKRASQIDVAKLAGVSDMTVHRVLQEHPHVREDTRRRVMEACAALNYRSNLAASSLRTKKSYALGLVCPELLHTYYVRLLNGAQKTASELGYHLIVVQLGTDTDPQQRMDEMEFLLQRQVDGLIISTELDPQMTAYLANESCPVITTEYLVDGLPFVGSDDLPGAKEAVDYLISLGHTRIAHLAGSLRPRSGGQRLQGYRQALIDTGIGVDEELVFDTDYRQLGGYRATTTLLDSGSDFSAIFAANDYVAVGAMLALYDRGLSVPDDVSVVGFAGDQVGEWTTPPLTTVKQPVEEVGSEAVKLLTAHADAPVEVLLPTELVVRRSCAKYSGSVVHTSLPETLHNR